MSATDHAHSYRHAHRVRPRPPIPPAGPIVDASTALEAISHLVRTDRSATVCLTLDDARWPVACIVVDHDTVVGPQHVDPFVLIVEQLAEILSAGMPEVDAVVLASFRPGRPFHPGDIETIAEVSMCLAAVDIGLVEWFVLDGAVHAHVRALVGEPPAW